uniref:Glycine N-acyltransferase-like protein n=1 Tax=Heterorhabditis bacteriophora TaxID=37862 RepID=A0A1I7WZR4_HETBA
MTKTWKYSEDGGLEQTKNLCKFKNVTRVTCLNVDDFLRLKLECFPSVCIRFKGKLAGFYMYEHLGYLNHQLVFEEHRGKGLGAILELVLSQKCIRHGINVCKLVEIGNAPVIAATKRSKYWTTAKEEDGNDVVIDFWNIDA